jgi:hypothetical protein
MKLIDIMPFPPEVKTITDAFKALNAMLKGATRNIPDGYGSSLKIINERHVHIYNNEPSPLELTYGYFWAIASRFKPSYNIFLVRHIPNPNPEEQPGRVFEIKWGVLPSDVE